MISNAIFTERWQSGYAYDCRSYPWEFESPPLHSVFFITSNMERGLYTDEGSNARWNKESIRRTKGPAASPWQGHVQSPPLHSFFGVIYRYAELPQKLNFELSKALCMGWIRVSLSKDFPRTLILDCIEFLTITLNSFEIIHIFFSKNLIKSFLCKFIFDMIH